MAKNNVIRRVYYGGGQVNDSARFRITESRLSLLSNFSGHGTECIESYNYSSNKNEKKQMMKGVCEHLVFCFKHEFDKL